MTERTNYIDTSLQLNIADENESAKESVARSTVTRIDSRYYYVIVAQLFYHNVIYL